jgi:hypothetical protein
MSLICPPAIARQTPNKNIHVFVDKHQIKKYAIPFMWTNDMQGLDRWYYSWYDQKGTWLSRTLIDGNITKRMGLTYLGRCYPQYKCKMPSWINDHFDPSNTYRLELYKHNRLGPVYKLENTTGTDAPIRWFSQSGQELHMAPVYGWGRHSNEIIERDQKWEKSVEFVGLCGG